MKLINFIYNHTILSCIIVFFFLIIVMYNHLIFTVYLNDYKLKVFLNIRSLFKLINIKIQIYPPKKKQNKKNKKISFVKLLKVKYSSIQSLIQKLKIVELYSQLEFGNTNFYITAYIDALINIIYGNIANIIQCKKLYLNFTPNFIEPKMKGKIKLHIKFSIFNLIIILPRLIMTLKQISELKEGEGDECNKFHSKYYGNNFGNN